MKHLFILFALAAFVPAVTHAAPVAIQDFAQFGIHATAKKKVDPRLKNLSEPEDQYFLEVKLGRLNRAQYDGMRAKYGNFSHVPFDATKEYDLIDFLHPAMQATVNQVFLTKEFDTSGLMDLDQSQLSEDDITEIWPIQKNGVASFSNCWNTTTQILKLQNASTDQNNLRYNIYWPGRWDIDQELKDGKLGVEVSEAQIEAGDALLVSMKEPMGPPESDGMIQHTALVLSDSLVFEKTDSSNDDPYRISFRQDVLKKYRRVFTEGLVLEYRRYNQGSDKTFEDPRPFHLKDSLTAKSVAVLSKLAPTILNLNLISGCETGLGGGCDVSTTELTEFKVVTNPKTGRGIFFGPRAELDRFQALKAE